MRLLVRPARQATALFIVTLALSWPAAANERVAAMLNEDLRYDVAFLWFSHVAVGRIRLQPGAVAGTYVASLDARTQGLSAFLTQHRRSRYESTMELSNGRFRPLRYEAVGSRGTGDKIRRRRKIYEFDYERREIRFSKVKTGFPDQREVRPMPAAGLSDILTAFYNLRAGFIGPIDAGAEVAIPTMVSDERATITIHRLDAAERKSHTDFPAGGQLYRVTIGREVFGTKDGAVLVWFDAAGQPGRTVVEDVLSLGDVIGTLQGFQAAPAADGAAPLIDATLDDRADR